MKRWRKSYRKAQKAAADRIRRLSLRDRIDDDIDGFEWGHRRSVYR